MNRFHDDLTNFDWTYFAELHDLFSNSSGCSKSLLMAFPGLYQGLCQHDTIDRRNLKPIEVWLLTELLHGEKNPGDLVTKQNVAGTLCIPKGDTLNSNKPRGS